MMIFKSFILLFLLFSAGTALTQPAQDTEPTGAIIVSQPMQVVANSISSMYYEKYKINNNKINYNVLSESRVLIDIETGNSTVKKYLLESPNGATSPPTKVVYWNKHTNIIDALFWKVDNKDLLALSLAVEKIPPYVMMSPIRLRAMQTRQFNKSPWEVASAIVELVKDKDGQCFGMVPPTFSAVGIRGAPRGQDVNGVQIDYFADYYTVIKGGGTCLIGDTEYTFEIDAKPPKSNDGKPMPHDPGITVGAPSSYASVPSCVVRVRMKARGKPIYDSQRHQNLFKLIADQIFVDALDIDPTQIN